MDLNSISEELREKALACKTTDELLELAKSEGINLSEEQPKAVSGGNYDWSCFNDGCPKTWAGKRLIRVRPGYSPSFAPFSSPRRAFFSVREPSNRPTDLGSCPYPLKYPSNSL